MVIPYAVGTPLENEFMMQHHLATRRRGRPAREPLPHDEQPALQNSVAAEMLDLTTLAIAALDDRLPHNEYLAHLQFLQPDVWQRDQLDMRETIKAKAEQINKMALHDDLVTLLERYALPATIVKRHGDQAEVPPLVPPVHRDADGVDDVQLLEVAAMAAGVADWPLVSESKTEKLPRGGTRAWVVFRRATWQTCRGSVVDGAAFVRSATRAPSCCASSSFSVVVASTTTAHFLE
jgi:hypothetical protein